MRGHRPECCELVGGGWAGSWTDEGFGENMRPLSHTSMVRFAVHSVPSEQDPKYARH